MSYICIVKLKTYTMRYYSELNGNGLVDIFTCIGQHLVEVDVSEERGNEIAEVMNEVEQAYSETMLIEFLDSEGIGGDTLITDSLKDNPNLEDIRKAFKEDARVNMW